MPWLRLSLLTSRAEAERAGEVLERCGAASISLEESGGERLFETALHEQPLWAETRVVGLFPPDTSTARIALELQAALARPAPPDLEQELLADQDWVRAWMDRWEPQRFGADVWIVPSWRAAPDAAATNIILDPGLAFGTGTHATTAMCLEWIAAHDLRGARVIDWGCGSGILAIAALMRGAVSALAVDIDPEALTATGDNAARNGVLDRMTIALPETAPQIQGDVVFANILAGPLVQLAPLLCRGVAPDGALVLSGLLTRQADEVARAYAAEFALQAQTREEWAMLWARKN